nr:glycosyltransferase [uncultured Rhodopila sp.]
MRVAIVVATVGRPEESSHLLDCLVRQSRPPSAIVLSVESQADLPSNLPAGTRVVMGPRGLAMQRNRGLELIIDQSDVIVFFDDDYIPTVHAVSATASLFRDYSDVVGATGLVLADGVQTGGLRYQRALEIVTAFDRRTPFLLNIESDLRTTYGCTMAFRSAAIGDTRFDENLPLYGWQEDVDFSARLRAKGRIVKTNALAGVHRGVTAARSSGVRLGFSQIVNPVYLVRKGTMQPGHAARIMIGNLLANHLRAFVPEPWIDRRGRLRGNWMGLKDIAAGNIDPQRVLLAEIR